MLKRSLSTLFVSPYYKLRSTNLHLVCWSTIPTMSIIGNPPPPPGDGLNCLKGDTLSDSKTDGNTSIQVSPGDSRINHKHLVHPFEGTLQLEYPSVDTNFRSFSDKRFASFRTWSGKFERQMSVFRGKPLEDSLEDHVAANKTEQDSLPADRYFAALEGPELEVLRPSECTVLPDNTIWPFLLRFPISAFGISIGISIQALLWKILATAPSTKFLHISIDVDMVLWYISLVLVIIISSIYLLKVILYFEAVRREYYHPIRVNFFFVPWIGLLLLAIGIPPSLEKHLHQALWYILMAPITLLELKIYGQWMLGGKRRLSKVANPTNHLAIIGNFVGAYLGSMVGLREGPLFFFAVGLAHFIVLFVTLYQRLPTNETLPNDLHPVFFLFIAVPSIGAAAWAKIQGSFDNGSRIAYFISLFLYVSLVSRVNLLRQIKFSLVWWAYTIPLTSAAIATVGYSVAVTNWLTKSLAVILSVISTLTVMLVLVQTMVHAFVLRDLFPNDIAIAITDRCLNQQPRSNNVVHPSREGEEAAENQLNNARPDSNVDLEAAVR